MLKREDGLCVIDLTMSASLGDIVIIDLPEVDDE